MTFASAEVRDKFHRRDTAEQQLYAACEQLYASRGFFLHIEDAASDIVIRISKKFIPDLAGSEDSEFY